MTNSVDMSLETQVVSKQKVTDHGEVLTGRREEGACMMPFSIRTSSVV